MSENYTRFFIREIDCFNEIIIENIAKVYSYNNPGSHEGIKDFWYDWFSNKIQGEKLTIIATETSGEIIVGVVRFWNSPYLENKWLIEGIETIPQMRRLGIARSLIKHGLSILKNRGIQEVSANISRRNIASIKLHESFGFEKVSTGTINSLGEYRGNSDEYKVSLGKK
ncbi:GNAT family N-acetyltransferase [Alkalicella caledoniensis]|uniref:GNAT family N-acetyltransferase n=1 Tax=Alkalicella caledoniensis TaxID=2731377 RepID=A0A7G9W691_ALKCA|nr:GNAT family N-acetyltransferase [Alkalicella caledoniensis]QNO14203.1 GNAT family N-acetyltransferase [Alkalicella caledoniensis]